MWSQRCSQAPNMMFVLMLHLNLLTVNVKKNVNALQLFGLLLVKMIEDHLEHFEKYGHACPQFRTLSSLKVIQKIQNPFNNL